MPRDFNKEARIERSHWLAGLVLVSSVILLVRLFDLQILHGNFFRTRSQENRIRSEVLSADRGRILTRHGTVLADDYPSSQLTFDPSLRVFRQHPDSVDAVIDAVARVLEVSPASLSKKVERHQGNRPVVLARQLEFGQVSRIEERSVPLAGLAVEVVPVRRYPQGRLACHLLGYLAEVTVEDLERNQGYRGGELIGKTGLELQYEHLLRGEDGEAYVEVDARGRRTRMFPELARRSAVPGHDIVITIDAALQKEAERALADIRPHGGKDGHADDPPPASCVVAMDPRTGEILALASYPGYDPNVFVGGLSQKEYQELHGPLFPQQNRVIQSTYPPGSTFKPVTSLAGLEQGLVGPESVLDPCWGRLRYGDRYFRCWKRVGHGKLDHTGALRQSCDVFYYQLADELQVEGISSMARRLQCHSVSGIDLPGERAGLVPTPQWYRERLGGFGRGVALNLSIGQGELLMSPLSLARFYGALATRGNWVRPHLLREVRTQDGNVVRQTANEDWSDGALPVSGEHLDFIRSALEEVVMHPRGTGKKARVGLIRIAGKTGTAENPGEDHALFACYAPADDPTIVVVAIAEHAGHGGAVAAPVAQRILDAYFSGGGDLAEVGETQP